MWTLSRRNLNWTGLALLAGLMIAAIWYMPDLDAAFIEAAVQTVGPAAIVFLVALGIVVSPIPSGAIALVAGALYGTAMGGVLTIAGAGLGAAGAFWISRVLGRGPLANLNSPVARTLTRDRSQGALMLTVFVTRLIPFISFDAVSYVAGLTPLRFWRFLVATVAGTTPVCLAFAAAGDTASSHEMPPALIAALCGITLILPALYGAWRLLRGRSAGASLGRPAPSLG